MVRHRQGHLLRDWIQKAELSGPERFPSTGT